MLFTDQADVRDTMLASERARLIGDLVVPDDASGVVVFADSSRSARHSPHNEQVAARLNAAGLGTLLVDLLTAAEELDIRNAVNIDLLTRRLLDVTAGLLSRPDILRQIGYFGAGTGTAAALCVAAEPDTNVAAIVSCSGRPDLAGFTLTQDRAPTLLIVGGFDDLLDHNRAARARLTCPNRLEILPAATHQFDEPGALNTLACLATRWFTADLAPAAAAV